MRQSGGARLLRYVHPGRRPEYRGKVWLNELAGVVAAEMGALWTTPTEGAEDAQGGGQEGRVGGGDVVEGGGDWVG
ncbi:hypothetical protein AB0918_15345 [Streptomyces sp. NPDC006864]|uniref:hypothetical protein n=1 Tax=Streptomyces sp. NPDC006864 TaxID=3154780 RepID=UPI0034568E39